MDQPTDWYFIWRVLRGFLEAGYFIAGVLILFVAKYAASQVKLAAQQLELAAKQLEMTQGIAEANRRRESVRLAAAQCKMFADEVVPASALLHQKYLDEKCSFLANPTPGQPQFTIHDGDFQNIHYDVNRVTAEWLKVGNLAVTFLNKCEAFAIPFAQGVAEDDIGFQVTGSSFCRNIGEWMPALYFLRVSQNVKFPNVMKLFNIWYDRLAAQTLKPTLAGIQSLVDSAEKNKIKPI